jgi:porphobilinogen synthase
MRDMIAQSPPGVQNLVAPLFACEGRDVRNEIPSMPGQYQFSCDLALETVQRWAAKGIRAVLLFGIPAGKDEQGSAAWSADAPVQRLAGMIKSQVPEMLVITDACLCEYTSHGHCGPIRNNNGKFIVDNDLALESLGKIAVSQARAGADVVAPSAMMDGQVAAIRKALDAEGFTDTAVMAYSAKFASALYGPFRDAAQSAPRQGDRKTYQMDYRSPRQAVLEAQADADEGADIIMVKPAGAYLDIIAALRGVVNLPLAAYHVSGEYACIKAAAANGWIDERAVVLEMIHAIRRAGADVIITYFAEDLADWL